MIYLVIGPSELTYHDTATEAALKIGKPKWDCAATAIVIRSLSPGDELDVGPDTSVICLTGKNECLPPS
jgi:hypothetical protein